MAREYGEDNAVYELLGLPLLYVCMEEDLAKFVPRSIRDQVRTEYAKIDVLPPGTNPVIRVPLNVYSVEDTLYVEDQAGMEMVPEVARATNVDEDLEDDDFDDSESEDDDEENEENLPPARARPRLPVRTATPAPVAPVSSQGFVQPLHAGETVKITRMLQGVLCRQDQGQQQSQLFHAECMASIGQLRMSCSEQFAVTNKNILQVAHQPARQVQRHAARCVNRITMCACACRLSMPCLISTLLLCFGLFYRNQEMAAALNVQLSKRPKNLFELWTEWTHGLGGNKPVSEWTAAERGSSKQAIWRRRLFWDCVRNHVNANYTSMTAINKIYGVYGRTKSVTAILTAMHADKRNNTGNHVLSPFCEALTV